MRSALLQVRMTNEQLRGFVSPTAQPTVNPQNCSAVTAQLLKLITPAMANQLTSANVRPYTQEWADYTSQLLRDKTYIETKSFTPRTFAGLFTHLFPGFGTFVVTSDGNTAHAFVVGRFLNGTLVILDPQIRKGYFNFERYFQDGRPRDNEISVIRTENMKPKTYYDGFSKYLAETIVGTCDLNTSPYAMDEDAPPSADVEMKLGGRKRRKTKRRLLAKRTLRRVNRRRRVI